MACILHRSESAYWKFQTLSALVALLVFSSLISLTQSYSPFNTNHEVAEHPSFRFRRSVAEQHNYLAIPANYSIHDLPPTPNGGPTHVNLSIMVTNVRDIKEIGEEISIEMNLRLMWMDSRLSESAKAINPAESKFMVLQPSLVDKLWHPDIFIDHVKSISQPIIISRPASLRLYPDSTLRYSTRITIVLSCGMDFHYYPADTQRCNVDVKSYAYSDTKMNLLWRDNQGASFAYEQDLSNFYVGMDKPDTFSIDTSSGSYSGLRFTILLTRKVSYHLIQTYLPSIVLVVVSWLSFLVNPDSVPGRMTICMTCLLTLISMFAAVRNSTPNVSYVKAIDIWMVVCVFFVFLALMEFTLVLKIKSMKPKKRKDSVPQNSNSDQAMGINHFNALRGSRGSVAHVYYPNQNLPQQRRLSQPRLSLSLPVNEENEMDEYSRPASEPGGLYASRPFPQLNRQLYQQHQPPLPAQKPPGPEPAAPNEYDIAAGRVEIIASVVVPTLFLAFNFVYWPWLIACSEYFTQESSTVLDS